MELWNFVSDVSRSQSWLPYFFSGTCTISTFESLFWWLFDKKNFKPRISEANNDILLKTNAALESIVTAFTNIGNMIILVMTKPITIGYSHLYFFFLLPPLLTFGYLYFFRPVRRRNHMLIWNNRKLNGKSSIFGSRNCNLMWITIHWGRNHWDYLVLFWSV